jgi:homoserine kinase
MMNHLTQATAFAPATSANVAVGFDVLGFAVAELGDEVTLVKSAHPGIHIVSISSQDAIPYDASKNTAAVALQAMLDYLQLKQGFELSIVKKIPLSSGLGGSAASSVAALVALNHLLQTPLPTAQLVEFALLGEEAACGSKHGDNVIPSLYGGLTLIQSLLPLRIIALPVLPLHVVLIHPHLYLDTRAARAALHKTIPLSLLTKQSANLASFISALYEANYEQLSSSCQDEVIEPMRASLLPNFYAVKAAAYQAGALACSISGSGPTLFALAKSSQQAFLIAKQMSEIFTKNSIKTDVILTTISSQGAKIIK